MTKLSRLPFLVALITLSRVVLGETEPSQNAHTGTGLEGVILIGPIHGGPSRQGIPDSKPLANVEFVVKKGNNIVASFTTDDQGRFHLSLPAGHYTVSRKDYKPSIGRFGPFDVEVTAGEIKKVQWDCDSGIR